MPDKSPLGRHLDNGAGAGGNRRFQQSDLAHDDARQPRRQSGAGADLQCLWPAPLAIGGAHIALRDDGAGDRRRL